MEFVILGVFVAVLAGGLVMWVGERHWATIYEGSSEHTGQATALNRALRSRRVRSRLEMTPPRPAAGAPGLALEQPLEQSVRVRVHRDDIEPALEVLARGDWRAQ